MSQNGRERFFPGMIGGIGILCGVENPLIKSEQRAANSELKKPCPGLCRGALSLITDDSSLFTVFAHV